MRVPPSPPPGCDPQCGGACAGRPFTTLAWPATAAPSPERARPPTVLLLVSLRSTAVQETESAFRETLEAEYGAPVDLHVEYLDLPDGSAARLPQMLADLLLEKYRGQRVDAVVVQRPEALEFLLRHRQTLFPGVPVVFFDVFRRTVEAMRPPPDVTGASWCWRASGR